MSGTDLEHRTEIRKANRTTPIWIGLVALTALVALVVGRGDDDGEAAPDPGPTTVPATPTSETLTTTSPRGLPPVYGLTPAGGEGALFAFSTATGPSGPSGLAMDQVQAAVTTDDVVVVLAGGRVHAAVPGESFEEVVGCCIEGLHPSNEPGHVWLHDEDEVSLLQIEGGGYVTELDIGDGEVLGPASFGVVVRSSDGAVRWHRPSFEPTDLGGSSDDRRAIDAGGERLLVAAPATATSGARLEVWSITGNGLLSTHELADGFEPEGLLAPDGSVVLVPAPGGWEVRDAATGLLHGTLPKVTGPVWVGGNRFAATLDDQLVVSDSGVLPLRWPVLAVAEQSP
ncbi:MAG TPA: hypothetical protein VLR27_17355 [Acidimicrobiales bacterium]|nr:hypothetical protein [Acidimicrobiales bacterium]